MVFAELDADRARETQMAIGERVVGVVCDVRDDGTAEALLTAARERPIPAQTSPSDSVAALLTAFEGEEPDGVAFERNRAEIYERLQTTHGFTLTRSDLGGIDYVYRAFYSSGPDIRYSFGRGPGCCLHPGRCPPAGP